MSMNIINNRKTFNRSIGFLILISLIVFVMLFMHFSLFNQSNINVALAEPSEIIYIQDEFDFENFLLDSANTNLITKGDLDPITSTTDGKKYILCNDIYLARKNLDLTTSRIWNALYFNGTFEGRGHAIVNFELDAQKPNVYSTISNTYGYAFFSYLGDMAVVNDLNFVAACIDFELYNGAIVAGTNHGLIDNVKVQGVVKTNYRSSGICMVNYGTIQNSLSIVNVDIYDELNSDISCGYITALNNQYATITNNIYYDFESDFPLNDSVGKEFYLDEQEMIVYQENCSTITEPVDNDYLPAYLISDYFGIVWYLNLFFDTASTQIFSMSNDINLYNVDINSTIYSGTFPEYFHRENNNFYNREKVGELYNLPTEYGVSVLPSASTLEESGSKEDPYIINNLSDLLACATIENNEIDYIYKYYRLGNDINLRDYAFSSSIINKLQGEFDGNNYSVSSINGVSLFGEISINAIAKNLRISGKVTGQNALLASTNYGTIKSIDIDLEIANSNGVGVAYNNYGSIEKTTVRTQDNSFGGATFVGVSCSNSSIYYSRSLHFDSNSTHEVPFVLFDIADNLVEIFNCSNVNNIWNISLAVIDKIIWVDNGEIVTNETSVYDLITNPSNATGVIYHRNGWGYCNTLGTSFAFVSGQETDNIELVFPSDNHLYKMNSFFKDSYKGSELVGYYGDRPSFVLTDSIIENMLISNPTWAELEEINGSSDGDGILVSTGGSADFNIGVSEEGYINRLAIEWIVLFGLNTEVQQLSGYSFSWEYNNNPFVSSAFNNSGTYNFVVYNDYFDCYGSFYVLPENLYAGELNYSRKEYFVNSDSVYYNANFIGISDDLVIEKKQFQYDEFEVPQELPSKFFNQVGKYLLTAEILSSETTTAFKKEYAYRIDKGNLLLTISDFNSKIGGFEIISAPIFNGSNYDFSSPSNLTVNHLKPGYEIQVQIIKLLRPDSSEVYPSVFVLAGKYFSEITLKVANFNDLILPSNFYIRQKQVIVDLAFSLDEIVFGDSIMLENISYSRVGEIFNYPLESLTFNTTYLPGSPVGTYVINPKISTGADNNNYSISFGSGDSFSVSKAELDLSQVGFISKEEKYDFSNHLIAVDKSKVILKNADLSSPVITCMYQYNLTSSSIPFVFSNVGVYNLSATVSAGNNYNPKTIYATLSVSHRLIKIFTKNEEIFYGDSKPNFTIYSVPVEGELESSSVIAQLSLEGVSPTFSCEYLSNSSAGWPDRLNEGGLYYELPVILNNVEVKKYSNFEIVNNLEKDGLLKVNKKAYSTVGFPTSFVYSGSPVNIVFIDGVIPSSRTWFSVENEIETNLSNAPINVSLYKDGTRPENKKYRLKATFSGNYKYLPSNDLVLDFDITQASLGISGLYLFTDGVKGPLLEGSLELPYIGTTRYLSFDNTLPISDAFLLSITCNEIAYTNQEIPIKNAGNYSGISYEISCIGIQNYQTLKSNYSSNLVISPKEVNFSSSTISSTYLAESIIPNFSLEEGSVCDGDEVNTNAFLYEIISYQALNHLGQYIDYLPTPQTIFYPGRYSLKAVSTLNNYRLGANNQALVQLSLESAQIELDLDALVETSGKIFEETYLNLRRNSLKPIDIAIRLKEGYEAKVLPIELMINSEDRIIVEPGIYDISGAREILKILSETIFVPCVKFTIKQNTGNGKVMVNKREVSFNWDAIIAEELVYKGGSYIYSLMIEYIRGQNSLIKLEAAPGDTVNLIDQNPANITKISINDLSIYHTGTYELIATCDMSSRYVLVSNNKREVKVIPRTINYLFSDVMIFSGDQLPEISSFNISFDSDELSLSILNNEISNIKVSYSTPYNPEMDVEGDFDVTMQLFVDNESIDDQDFLFSLSLSNQGNLVVKRNDFTGITISQSSFIYDGLEKFPVLSGTIPEGTIIQYSINPIRKGEFPVTVTLSRKHYNTKEISGIITISPALPEIVLNNTLPIRVSYRTSFQFNEELIDAYAVLNGLEVLGRFSFIEVDLLHLKFGLHNYPIRFTPNSTNFTVADSFIQIESYLDPSDVTILGETNYSGDSEVIEDFLIETESDYYRITLDTIEGLPEDVNLYVNGILVYGGQFTFYEDMEEVIVEIKTQDGVILSQNISVKLNYSGEPIVENPEGNTPSTPVVNGANPPLSGGAIAGIAVGSSVGLGGIIFLIIFLIKKKGKL